MVNRRSVVKGTAWAVPSIVATSVLPAYAASTSSGPEVCSTLTVGAYDGEANRYPLSISFGGSYPNESSELAVTMRYRSQTECPTGGLLTIANPCNGMLGTSGVRCASTPQEDGTYEIVISQSVTAMYFDYHLMSCGPCPFSAKITRGVPEGAVITLDSSPTGSEPAWQYVFTLGDFGSARPAIAEVGRTPSFPAPLNVSYA
ncbi:MULTISPECIES: hypothetical protein [Rothia]|uniref:Uncharacterized protein n=1 Tax=Rothia nasimurium TaxID=85336 RepID=A0A1Y1RNC7_9MICC|nr:MULTISPECIES: hypothetical protein [Rothia]ORC16088.1 hypothetical protein A7979_05660 [Rothia nasimurium]